ncbi:hypothetical protein CKO28_11360 [Rhodovibrio sodomensis]|uniref:Uncharacterized protein n=1 Tax=Rhodovibrio sodomensis TaxID=1088 RepID=A0ABS1DET3_9PROT|nr:hypothetical protein [Rhodovibrio sodomensis]MBK1668627.1 hypothetical protein [Rhodovibrio sodomensis]
MSEAGQTHHSARIAKSRGAGRDGPGLDGFTLGVLGICAHLAGMTLVVLAVMGLMTLYDALAVRLGDPALAGLVVGPLAIGLIGAKGMLGLVALCRRDRLRAQLAAALDRGPALRRLTVWTGFVLAVGVRAALLVAAAAMPVVVLMTGTGQNPNSGISQPTVYALLALSVLILAPLVGMRTRRGLRRLRLRRDRALRARAR